MVKFDIIRPPQADPPKIANSKQSTITLDELYAKATRADNYCVYFTYITGTCCIMGHPFLLNKKTGYLEHPGSDTHRLGGLYFHQFSIYTH